jgi:hypothetical protein
MDTQLIEVGEDRTFVGRLVDGLRKVPLVDRLISHDVVGGLMTKEDIQALRANGVNLISLDKIEHNDSRLSSSYTLSDVRNNAYVFIPIAIAAAALTPRDQGDKLLSTTAQRSLIQLLVATTLPDEARVLYNAVDAGISEYNKSPAEAARANNVMTLFAKTKAVGIAFVSKAVETIGKIGLSNIMGQSISTSAVPTTIAGTAAKTIANVAVAKAITKPIIGAVTGALTNKGVVEGFLEGVDSSTFGLTRFSSKKSHPSSANVVAAIGESDVKSGSIKPTNIPQTQNELRRRNRGHQVH